MLQVRLEPDTGLGEWGGRLCGLVVLQTGDGAAQVRLLRVSLERVSQVIGGDPALAPVQQTIRGTWQVEPGVPRRVPFALAIPWRVLAERHTRLNVQVEWRERLKSPPFWRSTRDATAYTSVRLGPSADLERLVEVVAEVTRTRLFDWRETGGENGVRAVLRPRKGDRPPFDAVTLEFHSRKKLSRGYLYSGRLLLDLAERSVADRLKAAVGLHSVSLNVRLQAGELEGVAERLAERLRRYVSPLQALPLPASAPEPSTDTLPRPASALPLAQDSLPLPSGAPEVSDDQ